MTLPRAEPRYFGPPERPLFGWLHRPAAGARARDTGLVICNPFGIEVSTTHRSLRHFAAAAAGAGIPALRFDYDGTGDSAGDDHDAGRWQAWLGSVHQAIDELKRSAGVQRVCLLGLRLGAAIGALAAAERDDVTGFVAINPVIAGKAWLRELNAFEIAMRFAAAPPGHELKDGLQESAGFVITPETKAAITSVDLPMMPRPPAPEVLILARDDLNADTRWIDHLTALGAQAEQRRLPGYSQMMLDPHDSVVPEEMVRASTDWIVRRSAFATDAAAAPPPPSSAGPVTVATGVEETAAFLDGERTLFGIVTAPAGTGAQRPKCAMLLLNPGAIPHQGPSRWYVELARRWAARGYLVLRFDQAGIGDSAPFRGDQENEVYASSAVRGVEAALAYLRGAWGVTQNRGLGLCSGAYHILKAAAAGLPLESIAVVNPLVFYWKPGMSLAYPAYQVSEAATRYKRNLFSIQKWKKVFAGKVNLASAANLSARRALSVVGALARNVARTTGKPMKDDLGAELEAIAARGVGLRFVFATGDPGDDMLQVQAGWSLKRLLAEDRLRIRRIKGPNHAFTPVWSRAVLTEVLEAELDVR